MDSILSFLGFDQPETFEDDLDVSVEDNGLNTTEIIDFEEESFVKQRTLADYDLIELVGKGAQGEVWKARVKETGQIIALKIINNMGMTESIEAEIMGLEKISQPRCHPFLACYYNHFYDEGRILIEMEFIEGKELLEWAQEFRDSGNYTALYHNLVLLTNDLAKALKFIHSKNIIHRDIKPENILITKDNVPKLVDFGISCESTLCKNKLEMYSQCCNENQIKGTPVYMAPESIKDGVWYPSSDVWSLAATLFQNASGEFIMDFQDVSSIYSVLLTIENGTPKRLHTGNVKLNDIVNLSLIKDPFARLTVDQLIEFSS